MDMELGGDENATRREAMLELARVAPPDAVGVGSGRGKRKRGREEEYEDEKGPLPKRVNGGGGQPGADVDEDGVVGEEAEMSGDTIYVADGDSADEADQDTGQPTEDATEPVSPTDKGSGDDTGPTEDPREIARAALGVTRRVSVRDLLSRDPSAGENRAEEREVERAAQGLMGLTRR